MSLFGSNAGLFGSGDAFSANYSASNSFTPTPSNVVGNLVTGTNPVVSAIRTSQNRNTERTTDTKGKKKTKVSGTQQDVQNRDTQSVSDDVLAAIDAAIRGNEGDPVLTATDEARMANMQAIIDAITNFDQDAIVQGAEGDVQALNRQLLEDVLPQVTGAVEASGSSNNALGALLAQDAASRTAEAGARVREQARANAAQEFLGMIQQATGATGRGSAVQDNLIALVNAAKGTVDRGDITTNTTFDQNEEIISEQQERLREGVAGVGSEDRTSSGEGGIGGGAGSMDGNMMAKLALLQSSLSPFQSLQDLTENNVFASSASKASNRAVRALATRLGIY